MRIKMLAFGIVVAFVLAVGVFLSGEGAAYANNGGGNNGCSGFGDSMPPVTPGAELGSFISDRAQDGEWSGTVKGLKGANC
ncbi:MAG: hypothetical protein QF898_06000 [SAR202 cluster bacterium]|nr:hypothetical protein [SAR202 cluster bacterium]MDP6514111.1 hypothetical protein [SAR202 cluster bacterium]MDP6714687.1 hypothetical protein [SAR202 cluster bacterium]